MSNDLGTGLASNSGSTPLAREAESAGGTMTAVNSFDVMKEMSRRNGKIMLVPLSNVLRAQAVKAGAQITIGAPVEVMNGIALGNYCGGLLLADSEEFRRVEAELNAKLSGPGTSGG